MNRSGISPGKGLHKDYDQSIVRYRDDTHQMTLVRTGGARIAHTPEELIRHINAYLCNPTLDAEGRHRIVKEQCWQLDGRASQRVAHAIVQYGQGRWDPEGFSRFVDGNATGLCSCHLNHLAQGNVHEQAG